MLTIGSIVIFWNPNHKSYSKLHHRDIAIDVQHVESSTGQTTSSASNLQRKTEQRNYSLKKETYQPNARLYLGSYSNKTTVKKFCETIRKIKH